MNKLWIIIVMVSSLAGIALGKGTETSRAVLESGGEAVQLLITLTGSMVLWSGMMEILKDTGDVERFGRGLRRGLGWLFPGLKDEECWSAMGMNMAANIMGLGNAATPAGIRAAQLLSRQGEAGLRALAMLLALNNASPQLMPATVITLRSAAGAANPADIWPATMAASLAATVVAAGLMLLMQRGGGRHE